jgi:peptidoglycan/xylan/chitin deacetylase (PgdA/CDA1 family)
MKQFIKRAQSLAFVFAMLLSVGVSAMPQSASAATTATSLTAAPRVTFTFDDGLSSALSQAAPILQKYGFSGTDYIITSCPGTTGTCNADPAASYMTWAEIKQLHDQYGWNIGSHTVDHPYLASTGGGEQTLLTTEQIHAELADSKAALAAQGYDAVDFAAPYGDYNNVVLAEAAKYYATFRGFADIGNNVYPYSDRLVVNEQVQEGTTGGATHVTFDMVKGYIDAAIAGNQWLALTFHNITSTVPTSSDDYTTSTALLDQIAAYVKSKNVAVVTPHDAIVNGTTNMLGDGSFDGTIGTDKTVMTGWETDDTTGTLVKKDTNINGSYAMGNATSATNSLYISAGANTAHVWAPRVAVNPNTTYVVKGFFNITNFTPSATVATPEVAYRIEEYDANGTLLNDHYASSAVRYDANVNAIRVKNANFTYKPTATNAAYARIYVDIQGGGGITGFMDNLEMFDPTGSTATTGKAGDVNGDGAINLNDLSIVSSNWNKTGMTAAQGDLNGDGAVNLNDLSILSSNWGK